MAEEKIIIGKDGPYPLDGILSLPAPGEAPAPAAILVHGSGSTNMDEKVLTNTPFRDIAEGLSMRGIASVRYDKRTFVYGKKLIKNHSLTVAEETIEDVLLAAALLKSDPRIDPDKIIIIGHSMGGMLAPRIDAMGGGFAGLILMAGTPRKLEEVLFEQLGELAATSKWPLNMMVKSSGKRLRKKMAGIYDLSDEEAKARKVIGNVRAYYFKEMGEHDAPSYFEKTKKPILVLQGGKDCQVSIRDFEMYRELLAGRDNVSFKLYPGLNHLFMPAAYGELKKLKQEYKIKSKVDECVLDDIANWIHEIGAV